MWNNFVPNSGVFLLKANLVPFLKGGKEEPIKKFFLEIDRKKTFPFHQNSY